MCKHARYGRQVRRFHHRLARPRARVFCALHLLIHSFWLLALDHFYDLSCVLCFPYLLVFVTMSDRDWFDELRWKRLVSTSILIHINQSSCLFGCEHRLASSVGKSTAGDCTPMGTTTLMRRGFNVNFHAKSTSMIDSTSIVDGWNVDRGTRIIDVPWRKMVRRCCALPCPLSIYLYIYILRVTGWAR